MTDKVMRVATCEVAFLASGVASARRLNLQWVGTPW